MDVFCNMTQPKHSLPYKFALVNKIYYWFQGATRPLSVHLPTDGDGMKSWMDELAEKVLVVPMTHSTASERSLCLI